MLVSGLMQKNNTTDNGFVTIMNDFQFMPKIMKQLWVQLFWFALFPCGFTPSQPLHNTFMAQQTHTSEAAIRVQSSR
jgi:hypothetical protein